MIYSGVEVYTTHPRTNDDACTLHADAVLCTLPLGVLKESLQPNTPSTIKFNPILPEWKIGAIKRMGYGNLNKVRHFNILLFTMANVLIS